MAEPKRPGVNTPEEPRVPPPAPEIPERSGAPEREIPGIPGPEPEVPRQPDRPEAPLDPNAPGQ